MEEIIYNTRSMDQLSILVILEEVIILPIQKEVKIGFIFQIKILSLQTFQQ